MTHHKLKIDDHWFDRLADGSKTAEVRKHDRDYQIGDFVTFSTSRRNAPWEPVPMAPANSREIDATITHILPASVFPEGVAPGYSVLSLRGFSEVRVAEVAEVDL